MEYLIAGGRVAGMPTSVFQVGLCETAWSRPDEYSGSLSSQSPILARHTPGEKTQLAANVQTI